MTPAQFTDMTYSHPAVVLGLSANGLGIVRSLYAAGVPIIAVDQCPGGVGDAHRWMSSKTRLCRKIFYSGGSDALLQCLVELGRALPAKGVLFPSGDSELLCVSRYRDALAPYFLFRVPDGDVVELLADKSVFYSFAESGGVAIPQTFTHPNSENIQSIADQIHYPCLIKANIRDSEWNRLYPNDKALRAENRNALLRLFDEVYPRYRNFLVQEEVTGPDGNLYFSHVYLAEDLRVLALWTGRKVRQKPIHFGTSTMTETVWVEEVAAASISLLQELRCIGYSSIEFKRDPVDNKYKIMEVTPGRTWFPHFLGFGAGVNIPLIWYRDLLGVRQGDAGRATEGVRWVDEYRDPFASWSYWRAGELGMLEWLRSFKGTKVYAYADWRDPLPLVCTVLRLLLAGPLHVAKRLGL